MFRYMLLQPVNESPESFLSPRTRSKRRNPAAATENQSHTPQKRSRRGGRSNQVSGMNSVAIQKFNCIQFIRM